MKFKNKKIKKYRGSKTHGGGAMKKRRGAGHRGGRGMAGSGKRGDAKKPSIAYDKKYFGKHGFKNPNPKVSKKSKKISIQNLEENLSKLLKQRKAEKKGNVIFVDLKKLGYNKLLGNGKINTKFEIDVNFASKKAIEKIQKVDGRVNVLVVKKEKSEKEEKAKNEKKNAESEKPAEEQREESIAVDKAKTESKE